MTGNRVSAATAAASGRVIDSAFRPHPLMRNPHVQTIVASQLRPEPPLRLSLERWHRPDGDWVQLGWSGSERPDAPVAVLVHGLTGGFHSKYLRATARLLGEAGWRCVILQLRGGGDQVNRLPRTYHHGDTEDLRALWHRLRAEAPDRPLASIGWSMGGNITLKALAEEGEGCPVTMGIAASVPFRLPECVARMSRGLSRVYQARLMRDLKAMAARKHAALGLDGQVDIERVRQARDFREFDDAWTAPLHDFSDAQDYYDRAACGQYLPDIRRPTHIIHALDDPFMDPRIVPSATGLAPGTVLELSPHGGHVGFLAADRRGGIHYWLENRIAKLLQPLLAAAGS